MGITALRTIRIALVALAGAGVLAASVEAKTNAVTPPVGRYTCYQFDPYSGYLASGWFKLLSSKRYVLYTGGGGAYSYKAGTRRVTFLSGPYKAYGWKGEFLPKGRDGRKGSTIVLTERVYKDEIKIHCYWGK
jgi:hypothetical protein